MKRIICFMLAFVVIICLTSCDNKKSEANLKNDIDSLSYALGVVQTQGLKDYLVNSLSVDTVYIDDFIKGVNEGANAGDSKQRTAYLAGISIGQQISGQLVKGINAEVFGDGSPKTISLNNYMAGFISGLIGNNDLMTIQRAIEVSQRLMSEIKNRENLEINRAGDKEQQLTEQTTQHAPSINNEWQYLEKEDKLNGIRNYEAKIISIDGKIECSVSAIDLTGSGNYTNILSVAWYDDAIPACHGKLLIGMKFPNDTQWRKIPIKCNGHAGALVGELKLRDEYELLKSSSQFSILIANEEFVFKPSEPLRWSH